MINQTVALMNWGYRYAKKNHNIWIIMRLYIRVFNLGSNGQGPAPEKGGDGFKAVSLEEAKKLHENGAVIIACHSHTTDFMKGHPSGTIHITCLFPKDHKRTDLTLSEVNFDITQLPKDKTTPIVTYCASNT